MTAFLGLVAAWVCAQAAEPAPKPAASKIAAVTVYQGQALVTREVSVPEGEGTVELVVTPLPPQVVENSVYAEGGDGQRVLSTRFRSRAVQEDTRREVRAREERLQKLDLDMQRLRSEVSVQEQNLAHLSKLEDFTRAALNSLTGEGRLDSEAVLTLSRFVMENRGTKTKAATDLQLQLQAATAETEFVRRQVAELSAGSSRTERDAVIVVNKTRAEAGTVRLGYLVGAATWMPQYRLRGGAAAEAPVRLEYLGAVVQQTGEDWREVGVTLSTARPSLDAAPPELLPLTMSVAGAVDTGPIEAQDDRSQRIATELGKLVDMPFAQETPLEDVLKHVRASTKNGTFAEGIPIYVDPVGLQEAEKTMSSPVTFNVDQVPLRTALRLMLKQLGLTYHVKDGLLSITAMYSHDAAEPDEETAEVGMSLEQAQAAGGGALNQLAARDQARELRVNEDAGTATPETEKDIPSVTFPIAGRLDVPSRKDPQLLEVARLDLAADPFAKAVPVLTPRVYRLARLTNKSDVVLLPGEATVYVGGDFVGRMRLPLVAAGEPFVAGFGVDPQVQISRRLARKTRSVQGGNQVFDYEFRIGVRNYRAVPVKVQVWDRLPKPPLGETVVVSHLESSVELSSDPIYQRTGRNDNLLRWDLEVPPGTVGEKTMYLGYEFRLEYARDLPAPRFVSGGLREAPIGGGAMGIGGMGGMGGGFRSVKARED
jgi:hypothetical protein